MRFYFNSDDDDDNNNNNNIKERKCIRVHIIFFQVCLHILKVVAIVTFYCHTDMPINNNKNNINEE